MPVDHDFFWRTDEEFWRPADFFSVFPGLLENGKEKVRSLSLIRSTLSVEPRLKYAVLSILDTGLAEKNVKNKFKMIFLQKKVIEL